jgi:hypothetical protein
VAAVVNGLRLCARLALALALAIAVTLKALSWPEPVPCTSAFAADKERNALSCGAPVAVIALGGASLRKSSRRLIQKAS